MEIAHLQLCSIRFFGGILWSTRVEVSALSHKLATFRLLRPKWVLCATFGVQKGQRLAWAGTLNDSSARNRSTH